MLTDITEQKEAEAALSKSEANLRAFFESTEDMICGRDREGGLLFWNEAFDRSCRDLFGVEASVGLQTGKLIPSEQREAFKHIQELFYKVFEGNGFHEEFNYKWPNGEIHYYEIQWLPAKIGNNIVAVAEVTRDITKKRKSEVELEKNLERFKGYLYSSNEAIFGFEIDPPMPMILTIDEQIDYLYDHARIVVANEAWAKYAGLKRT